VRVAPDGEVFAGVDGAFEIDGLIAGLEEALVLNVVFDRRVPPKSLLPK
jgi:hypothetical protein